MDLGNWIQLYFATYSRKTLAQFAAKTVFKVVSTTLQSYQVEFPFAIAALSKQA